MKTNRLMRKSKNKLEKMLTILDLKSLVVNHNIKSHGGLINVIATWFSFDDFPEKKKRKIISLQRFWIQGFKSGFLVIRYFSIFKKLLVDKKFRILFLSIFAKIDRMYIFSFWKQCRQKKWILNNVTITSLLDYNILHTSSIAMYLSLFSIIRDVYFFFLLHST